MPDIKTSVMSIAIALASCASGIAICPVLMAELRLMRSRFADVRLNVCN
jgi:hypothetical protein